MHCRGLFTVNSNISLIFEFFGIFINDKINEKDCDQKRFLLAKSVIYLPTSLTLRLVQGLKFLTWSDICVDLINIESLKHSSKVL